MVDTTYPAILAHLGPHLTPQRSESASFLMWYLENYLRLDALDAVDAVCDHSGDRGIDGIYVNHDANVIEIYQAKLFQRSNAVVGDRMLREFQGSLSQFTSREAIQSLLDTAGDAEVARLARRLDLVKHIDEFDVIGYFVCNGAIDANGRAFLQGARDIRFVGSAELVTTFVPAERTIPPRVRMTFDVAGYDTAEYIVDAEHRAVIAPIRANQLVQMDGLANQTVFAFNVRGDLGRTQVNRDIAKSIRDQATHKLFPLFHNGITVIAETVENSEDEIAVENYFVVNGCQSLTALSRDEASLTENLRVLTKFIQAAPASQLAERITRYSNTQNGMKVRDFKSNNQIQIRLQNEFKRHYGTEYFFEIKRGEDAGGLETISNETAGQYLMAWDLKIPWATHRKYQIFEELHSELFGRPEVTAHRIVLCHILTGCIVEKLSEVRNQLFARYALTRLYLLYVVRLLVESDPAAQGIVSTPRNYVDNSAALRKAVGELLSEVITDLNAEIDELESDFDYRGRLRDESWCIDLANEIVGTHIKLVGRHRVPSLGETLTRYITESERPIATSSGLGNSDSA